MNDDPRVITDERIDGQPIPCLAGGGQSCGIWVYCDLPHGHDGLHEGWSATTEKGHAVRTEWTRECPECGEPVDAEGITLTTECCEHCCDGTCPEYHDSLRALRGHPAIPIPTTVPERTAARFTGPTITPEETP